MLCTVLSFCSLLKLIGLPIAPFHNFIRIIIHFDFIPSVLHVLCRVVLNCIEGRNVTARSYQMLPPHFESGRDYDNDIIIINLLVSRAAARKKAHKATIGRISRIRYNLSQISICLLSIHPMELTASAALIEVNSP